jgi:hypothetical protein
VTTRQPLTDLERKRIDRFVRQFDRDFRIHDRWSVEGFIMDSVRRWQAGKPTYHANLLHPVLECEKPSLRRRLEIFGKVVLFTDRLKGDWRKVRNLYE